MCKKNTCRKSIPWIITFVALVILLKVSYEMKWLDLIWGIVKLETKIEPVQSVSLKSFAFAAHANNEEAFMRMMGTKGWFYMKHYGNGMIFNKEGYEILVSKHTYFKRYSLYEINTKEIFDSI